MRIWEPLPRHRNYAGICAGRASPAHLVVQPANLLADVGQASRALRCRIIDADRANASATIPVDA
ncbi:MAG: hypothetical protein EB027_07795 [Actinobacteria bacterium]|nr:hypothetical protein [Actinomycetota bacterium]